MSTFRSLHARVALLTSFCLAFALPTVAQVNVVTQHNDIGRTGQNLNETILTPTNVAPGQFGKLFSAPVDGQVYAQPLYLSQITIPGQGTHNVVYVATEHDSVYAFDADSGAKLWQITLLDAAHGAAIGATTDPETDTGCSFIDGPEFGITGTPVIDPVSGTIYVVGKTLESGYPVQRLHALDVTTGAEKTNSPVTLSASFAGTGNGSSNGTLSFDPKWELQRPGLLLLNGIVYIGFGSSCDLGPYHGWVLAYNGSTLAQTSAFVTTPNGYGGGIWQGGAGLAADVPTGSPFGRMFVSTGNGTFDATTPYATNSVDYADDVLRLDLTGGVMTVSDAFTPYNQAALNSSDSDVSSGGVVILPDQTLTGHTHQMVAAGRSGTIYLLDRDNLGGYNSGGTTDNDIESVNNQIAGVFGDPAYFNQNVYFWAQIDKLKDFGITNGQLNAFYNTSTSTEQLGYPGGSVSVSANGSTNGIIWSIDSSAYSTSGNANLLAHSASNLATTLYNSATVSSDNPGLAVKFAVPTVANGKVYVGAASQLSVYGLLPNFTLTPAMASVSVAQAGTATDNITIATVAGFSGNVTLSASGLPSGVTASYAAGTVSGTSVLTLTATAGATLGTSTITVTGTSGTLTNSASISLTVTAGASSPSFTLTATPSAVSLNQGQSATSNITVVPVNGFSGAVTLLVSGLPTGVTGNIAASTGSASVLTLTAAANAPTGPYTLTVTGTSGTGASVLTTSITVNLTVAAQAYSTTPFVTTQTPGALRNNFSGFVGFAFTTGSSPITVYSLGRIVAPGNSGTHIVKLANGSDGSDVVGGSVSITITGTTGQYQYATLASPLTLPANTSYFLLSQEAAGGDQWYDIGPVTSATVASVTAPAYQQSPSVYVPVTGLAGQSYVPVNFLYGIPAAPLTASITSPVAGATLSGNAVTVTVATTGPVANVQLQIDGANQGLPNVLTFDSTALTNGAHVLTVVASDASGNTVTSTSVAVTVNNLVTGVPFVIGQTPGPLRNNYTGFVGFSMTVGATPVYLTSLGRLVAPGNSGTHQLKIVDANGNDVPGGSVTVSLANATPGQYFFGSLPALLTLQPNTSYFLVSQETSGGDQWYDYGFLSVNPVATVNGPSYTDNANVYHAVSGLSGQAFVPLSFLYQTTPPTPSFTLAATPSTLSITQGQSAMASVLLAPSNGFSGTVTLAVTGAPTGVTATAGAFSSNLSVLSISVGGTVTPDPYTLTVTGTLGTLSSSTNVTVTVLGPAQPQTITFNSISTQGTGTTLALTATASSALPVSYMSSTTSVCTVSGSTATLLAAGTCTIIASQSGNTFYSSAAPVTQSFVVSTVLPFVLGQTPGPLRNNFTGFVGFSLTVGPSPVYVASLGRFVAPGNTATHVVKIVDATGTDVPGGSATVTTTGATVGQFAYASLPATLVLQANTSYYLVSQETSGGDQWYDFGFLSTNPVVTVNGPTYTDNAGNYNLVAGLNGQAYVPLSFLYLTTVPPPSFTLTANPTSISLTQSQTASSVITIVPANSFSGTVALSVTGAPTGLTVSASTVENNLSALRVVASSTIAPGPYPLIVTGTSGTLTSSVTVTVNVVAQTQTQTITFATIPDQSLGTPLTLTATASSGLVVAFATSTPAVCTVTGTTVNFLTTGTCTIVASQSGNSTYSAALSVSQSFAVGLASQTITFGPITTQILGTPLTLTASATSGLPVSYASSTAAVCTVSGSTVTFLTSGTCTIVASQAGNATYAAATSVTQNIAVGLQSQTITFGAIPAQTVGTPLTLTASASSGLPVSYASSTAAVCTVSGSTVTFLTSGTCTIVASQAGNATYAAATSVTQNIAVGLQSQTITFGTIPGQTVGTPLTLTASATSGLPVSYASSTAAVCTVSGSTVTFLTSGTCTIVASQAGNSTYAAATSVTQNIPVGLQSQTITFGTIPGQTVGTPLTLTASATSGLPVSYASSTAAVCTVSGGTVTFLTSGTCTIVASQAGNSTYAAATSVTQNIAVGLQSQTITFGTIPAQTVGTPLTLTASATSGLPVSYASSTAAVCTVSGSTVTFLTSGTCTIVASQAGNSTYAAATSVTQNIAVGLQSQTITFGAIPAQTVGTPLTLTATATSGLPVSYASSTAAVCTVSGSTVTFLTSGTCTIVASQAGNSTYAAATSVTQNIAVGLQSQTITFGAIPAQTVGTPLTLTATATSGLPVSYASSTAAVCTVSGSTVTFLTSGTCTIVASQAGNSAYAAANSVTQTFSVNAASLKSQTITFNAIPAQTVGTSLTVSATASSALPVTFTIVQNGNCSISGNVVTFLNVGNCGVIANQAGNSTYAAAPAVGQVIVVNSPKSQTITFGTIAAQTTGTTLTLTATASSGLAVTYTSSTTSVCTVSGSTATFLAAGTCTITASQSGNGTYSAAASVTQSFTVKAPAITVTITALTLAPNAGNTTAVTIKGATTAPALGLGTNNACVNVSGCTYNLGGTNGSIGFEFVNVSTTGGTLVVFVPSGTKAGTYTIPDTIGSTQVGTFSLTVS